MLFWLGEQFLQDFPPLRVLSYISFRGIFAAITALLISFIVSPSIIRALKRFKLGQSVRTDGPQDHLIKSGTPTMGGVIMIVSILIATLLWQRFDSFYTWIILLSLLGFGALGFVDDYLKIKLKNSDGVSAKMKIIVQVGLSLLIVALIKAHVMAHMHDDVPSLGENFSLLYLPFFKEAVIDLGWVYFPFVMVILIGTSNATNLTDGLDGLLTGLLIFAFGAFMVIAYISGRADFSSYLNIPHIQGSSELVIPAMAIIGACIGFLWYNSHPAEIFMGDVGSLAFGATLGIFSIILKKEILLIIIGGVFVMEALSVMIQVGYFRYTKKRYGTGRRILRMAPLHHHFEITWKEARSDQSKPWSETKVVIRFWILGILFTLFALATLKLQ
ncbi:phospho-N-acetylmuramoyl-pentapeptide-transferase [Entomospira culicis]|uniref:Phospho-N-acetylmuramoyl-pentapeptide-transferase n=1 Tax=Entomospira culicis TaxID=2719989 RepID=A0A968KUK0_9SPIO|nr:phospho-N-acetylmuramoyl-pentapeptide-transferase [Entomospira culicis]NIZ19446.1 phospho-N-acetylmuramoyl-pentapeptide-transferase [Entomospira culicis]NIZ69649.1 phospho-N-acetylmuramoyl-pentapeptide-transferase [Entomospira culicis]WDI36760.1 phospho-N-acetylmuramoyl-pentapeptide-transferase [Entomospira culicis]WDI38389.1 phospho-N-acetylmuramoyl-pentapeptide-transferase [Entomospira culicis]